jgi:hypothetical protein
VRGGCSALQALQGFGGVAEMRCGGAALGPRRGGVQGKKNYQVREDLQSLLVRRLLFPRTSLATGRKLVRKFAWCVDAWCVDTERRCGDPSLTATRSKLIQQRPASSSTGIGFKAPRLPLTWTWRKTTSSRLCSRWWAAVDRWQQRCSNTVHIARGPSRLRKLAAPWVPCLYGNTCSLASFIPTDLFLFAS